MFNTFWWSNKNFKGWCILYMYWGIIDCYFNFSIGILIVKMGMTTMVKIWVVMQYCWVRNKHLKTFMIPELYTDRTLQRWRVIWDGTRVHNSNWKEVHIVTWFAVGGVSKPLPNTRLCSYPYSKASFYWNNFNCELFLLIWPQLQICLITWC